MLMRRLASVLGSAVLVIGLAACGDDDDSGDGGTPTAGVGGDDGGTPTGADGNTSTGDGGDTPTGDDGNTPTGDGGNTTAGDGGNTTTGDDGNTPTGDGGYTGPYSDCENNECDDPSETQCLVDVPDNPTFIVCSMPGCSTVNDCPAAPPTGDAPVACADIINDPATLFCVIDCSGGQTCPDGMFCHQSLPIPMDLCGWPTT